MQESYKHVNKHVQLTRVTTTNNNDRITEHV